MWFNQYPYINVNDLNLDFLLKAIRDMKYEVENFVSINAIKYANPIQWNITSQYEKNTVVIDGQSGVAYISVAPVPAGVSLDRTEFWTVIFDLSQFITGVAKNLSSRYESVATSAATFSTPAGGWLVWGDVLYKANVNITTGDLYAVGGNISHITIEDVYIELLNKIGVLAQLTTNDKTSLVGAINEVDAHADANMTHIGDLQLLTTTAKDTIVNAVNEVDAHADANMTHIGDLQLLTTTAKDTLVNAINELNNGNRDQIILFGDSWADYTHDPTNVMIPQTLTNHFGCTVHNYSYGGTGFDVANGYDEQLTWFAADNIDPNTIKFVVLVCGLNDYQRTTTQTEFTDMIVDWYGKLTAIIGNKIPIYWFHNYSLANEVTGVTNPTTFHQQLHYYKYVAEHMNIPIIAPDTFAWVSDWRNDTHPNNQGSFDFSNNMCRAIEGLTPLRFMYSSVEFTVNGHAQSVEYYYDGNDLLDVVVKADIDDLATVTTAVNAPYTHSPACRIAPGEYLGAGFSIASNDYNGITLVCNAPSVASAFTAYGSYNNINAHVKMV